MRFCSGNSIRNIYQTLTWQTCNTDTQDRGLVALLWCSSCTYTKGFILLNYLVWWVDILSYNIIISYPYTVTSVDGLI